MPHLQVIADQLPIRESPVATAPVARQLRWPRGQELTFDQSIFRTLKSGKFDAIAKTKVTGRILGNIKHMTAEEYYNGEYPTRTLDVEKGEAVEYLQYRAEGTCFVRVGGQLMDADPCPTEEDGTFKLALEPEAEWWIRVTQAGKPVGWLLLNEKQVKEGERTLPEARSIR